MSTGSTSATSPSTTSKATYTVIGMTCEHCVLSVTEEVQDIAGVVGVHVDLASGAVTIHSDSPVSVSAAAVQAAVEEAGYHVA